jgi:hypothetical protein
MRPPASRRWRPSACSNPGRPAQHPSNRRFGWKFEANIQLIYDSGPVGYFVSLRPVLEPLDEPDRSLVRQGIRIFVNRGWIEQIETAEDLDTDCRVRPAGTEQMDDVRQRRSDRVARNKAVRDAVLHWVYEASSDTTTLPSMDEYLRDPKSWYFGAQLTVDEIDQASMTLKELGYIDGVGRFGGGITRPRITAKGRMLVESGLSVHDPPSTGGNVTYDQSTNVNTGGGPAITQAHRHGSTMNVAITQDNRQLALDLADRLQQALPQLGLTDAATLPDEIREATGADNPRVLRRVLESVVTQVATSTATALGNPLVQQAQHILHLLTS